MRGDVLQIVAFAVLFSMAVSAVGEKGQPIVRAMESLSQVMFKFTNYVMMFAPIGVGAAMAHTVGTQGLGVLVNLGNLILTLYLGLIIFVVLVFGLVIFLVRVPLRQFIRAVREPATLAFATTSSESALPKAMQAMERIGVPRHIVGLVMPTGYSFNLDGSTLYLAVASVFVAQAAETTTGHHVGLGQQITIMLALMITSKGVAAVPRASLVVLLATLNSFLPAGLGPLGVAVIFGVDELMDMGRTCVNLVGNCLATIVVARWEGEFDDHRARVFGTPQESRAGSSLGRAWHSRRRPLKVTRDVHPTSARWRARWNAFRFPINGEKQALLRERWNSLPSELRTPQSTGRPPSHPLRIHNRRELLFFHCTHCYLPENANKVPIPSLAQMKEQIDANRRFQGPGGGLQITGGDVADAYWRASRAE